jgi:primase-polymerase (primpol)-like protein
MEQVTGVKDMQKRIVSSAMQFYRSQFPPFMPQDVIDDLTKSLENADLNAQAKTIYPKYISTEDASKIIEFYKTPTGQRMVAAQPEMTTEMQRSSIQIAQQTAKDVIERHKPEIEAAQQKYIQERQSQAKPSLNSPGTTPNSSTAPATPKSSTTTTTPKP